VRTGPAMSSCCSLHLFGTAFTAYCGPTVASVLRTAVLRFAAVLTHPLELLATVFRFSLLPTHQRREEAVDSDWLIS
jgi:hypothetical protein